MWHTEKLLTFEQEYLQKKLRTQDILLEIEKAHSILLENKQQSAKKFDTWLKNQSFIKENNNNKMSERNETILAIKAAGDDNSKKLPQIIKTSGSDSERFRNHEVIRRDSRKRQPSALSSTTQSEDLMSSQELIDADRKRKETLKNEEIENLHSSKWNYSTKVEEKVYTKNLDDFYPRDPYTFLPEDTELTLLHRQLSGMTLEEVKEFMKKNLKEREEYVKNKKEMIDEAKLKATKKARKYSVNIKTVSKEKDKIETKSDNRQVYYKPKHIFDYETKTKSNDESNKIHMATMNFGNDPTAFQFKQSKKYVEKNRSEPTIHKSRPRNKAKSSIPISEDAEVANDVRQIIERYFDRSLYEFMTLKNGQINPKYEKVFIV